MSKFARRGFYFGLTGVLVIAGWFFRNHINLAAGEPNPAIQVERHFELGQRELFTTAEASVLVRNKGRQPLVMSEISERCGCIGVFAQAESGERQKVEALEIPPGDNATLIVQFSVSGTPGIPNLRKIQFTTNDPQNRGIQLSFNIMPLARYFAAPRELLLGRLPVGSRVDKEIEILASERRLPAIRAATSSNDRIRLNYQPVESSPKIGPDAKPFELMGRLRVSFEAPAAPGEITALISVYCEGRQEPAIMIPVIGRVAPFVELTPREVLLPRVSRSGPVYTATCICRAGLPKPLTLELNNSPADVAIQIKDVPGNPSWKLLHIDAACLQKKVTAGRLVKHIALTAEVDGRREPLSLTLTLER